MNRLNRHSAIWALLLTWIVSSCAHHPRVDPVIKVPNFYDYLAREASIEAVVDPYVLPYKMEYIFSEDITEKGILALHLILWNHGTAGLDLKDAKIKIRSLKGREYEPLKPEEVSNKVLKSTFARVIGFGALGTAFIFFTVPFAVGAGVESVIANKNIKKDYEEKELKRTAVEPNSVFHGFLFFNLGQTRDEIKAAFNEAYRFYLEGLTDEATGERKDIVILFELPGT